MNCKDCGGVMAGDGVTMALHCEFVELPPDREVDAPPLYCGFSDAPDAGHEDDTSCPASWNMNEFYRDESEIVG